MLDMIYMIVYLCFDIFFWNSRLSMGFGVFWRSKAGNFVICLDLSANWRVLLSMKWASPTIYDSYGVIWIQKHAHTKGICWNSTNIAPLLHCVPVWWNIKLDPPMAPGVEENGAGTCASCSSSALVNWTFTVMFYGAKLVKSERNSFKNGTYIILILLIIPKIRLTSWDGILNYLLLHVPSDHICIYTLASSPNVWLVVKVGGDTIVGVRYEKDWYGEKNLALGQWLNPASLGLGILPSTFTGLRNEFYIWDFSEFCRCRTSGLGIKQRRGMMLDFPIEGEAKEPQGIVKTNLPLKVLDFYQQRPEVCFRRLKSCTVVVDGHFYHWILLLFSLHSGWYRIGPPSTVTLLLTALGVWALKLSRCWYGPYFCQLQEGHRRSPRYCVCITIGRRSRPRRALHVASLEAEASTGGRGEKQVGRCFIWMHLMGFLCVILWGFFTWKPGVCYEYLWVMRMICVDYRQASILHHYPWYKCRNLAFVDMQIYFGYECTTGISFGHFRLWHTHIWLDAPVTSSCVLPIVA